MLFNKCCYTRNPQNLRYDTICQLAMLFMTLKGHSIAF